MEINYCPFNEREAVEVAKALLAATDYAVLPDVKIDNADVFIAYRNDLREVMKNPKMPVVFPEIPEPVWTE
jgi:Trk K+ transport system NAD-binding subunit